MNIELLKSQAAAARAQAEELWKAVKTAEEAKRVYDDAISQWAKAHRKAESLESALALVATADQDTNLPLGPKEAV